MKKFLLAAIALFSCVSMASAAETTFDFKNETYGLTRLSGTTSEYITAGTTVTNGDVTITILNDKSVRLWSNGLRVYKNSQIEIAANNGNVTKIEMVNTNEPKLELGEGQPGVLNITNSNASWTGNAPKVVFVSPKDQTSGNFAIITLTVTTGEGGSSEETVNTLYTGLSESATEIDWTFDNITIPEAASYIWSWKSYSGAYYLNGSCYISGAVYPSEAYAISPVIDLTKATKDIKVVFDHAAKFQTTLKELCGFCVREEGATAWTALTIPAWPEAGSWDFVTSGEIDLTAYAGKKIQLAFKYGSSEAGADTWEIKNVVITGVGESVTTPVEPVDPEPQPGLVKYEIAKSIVSGEKYIMVVNGQYGAPINETLAYGRLTLTNGTEEAGIYSAPAEAAITITEVAGKGYTLVDCYNRYLGMDDSHFTSFQLYTEVNDGCYWTANDALTFTNALNTNCIICQSGTYANIAPAVVAEEGQTAPTLYMQTKGTGIADIEIEENNAPVEFFNLQGVRVENPANGLFIRRQGNKVTKVIVK